MHDLAVISEIQKLEPIEGNSELYNGEREGLVWRTADGKVHFKCKSRKYKLLWEKKVSE